MFDQDYLAKAYTRALNSPDPSTQNGAVLENGGVLIGDGCNTFPKGVRQTDERWERPLKYQYVTHAEVAAILTAARRGLRTEGSTLYAPWYACDRCAVTIIDAGVKHVVGHDDVRKFAEHHSPGWTDSIALALSMLKEAGVKTDWYSGPVEAQPIRVGGELFDPQGVSV